MEASLTFNTGNPDDDQEYFMLIGTRREWEYIVENVDGIGHCPSMLELLSELKKWGVAK